MLVEPMLKVTTRLQNIRLLTEGGITAMLVEPTLKVTTRPQNTARTHVLHLRSSD
jgi:hypothetical protein